MSSWNPFSVAGYRNIRNTYRDTISQPTRAKINLGLNYATRGLFTPALAAEKQVGGYISDTARPGQVGYTEPPKEQDWSPMQQLWTEDTSGGGGGSGSGSSGTATDPNFAWWMGNKYNFDDPNSVTNYANARRDYINNIFGNKYSTGERQYNEGIESVNRDISNLGTNKTDYLSDWQDQYTNLGKTYQGKRAGISNYYSGLGEGYQSSQGIREKNALDAFTQGTTKAERERANAETNFSQQEADLNKEKVDYGNWWTDLQRSIDEEKANELTSINQALDEAGATAEAQRLAGLEGDVYTRLRTNPYTAVSKMNPLAETSALANPVNSGIALGGGETNPLVRSNGTDDASKAVNKYYNLIEQTGDPGKALSGLTASERQLLSSLGI